MDAQIFPPGFPPELVADAFKTGSEAAWTHNSALKVVEWLMQNGFAVLGTELWVVRDDGIQPGIYVNGVREIHGNVVSHRRDATWAAYVARSAEETLLYLNSFKPPSEASGQGDIFFNVVWTSESEFLNSSMR
jgi:hypothetical protein